MDCIERYGNTSASSVPIALAEAERDGRPAPRRARARGRLRRRLHLGRGGDRVVSANGATTAARWSPAPRAASAPRSRAPWPPTAGPSPCTTAPTPRRRGCGGRADRGRPAATRDVRAGRRGRAGRRRRASSTRSRSARARCCAWSTTPACGPTRCRRRSTTSSGSTVARDEPVRRLPHHAPRPARHDARPLRPHRERGLGRRAAGQPRPGQLRRVQGRADRHDPDVAAEVARRGVTVNAVAPGLVATEMTDGRRRRAAEGRARAARRHPRRGRRLRALPRLGRRRRYVNGTTLTVDGGLTA